MTIEKLAEQEGVTIATVLKRLRQYGMIVPGNHLSATSQLSSKQLAIYQDCRQRVKSFSRIKGIDARCATNLVSAGFMQADQVLRAELEEIASAMDNNNLQTAWNVKKAIAARVENEK